MFQPGAVFPGIPSCVHMMSGLLVGLMVPFSASHTCTVTPSVSIVCMMIQPRSPVSMSAMPVMVSMRAARILGSGSLSSLGPKAKLAVWSVVCTRSIPGLSQAPTVSATTSAARRSVVRVFMAAALSFRRRCVCYGAGATILCSCLGLVILRMWICLCRVRVCRLCCSGMVFRRRLGIG